MEQHMPLTGVKVIEVGLNLAGPLAGEILAGLGADVKAEPIMAETKRNLYDGVPIDEVYNRKKKIRRRLFHLKEAK